MHNLLRSRRGSAAFATLIALVPLIGVVALGGEAGSWYVTKQHAQNAADAGAYSGALRLACQLAGPSCNDTTQTVAYRGKEFAAQNTFCNAGDSTAYPGRQCAASLPAGVSQAVQIDIGDYNAGTFTTPPVGSGNAVRAKVSQQQPAYLAAVLGLTTVNIPTQAIAQVQDVKQICGLGLSPTGSALTLSGSVNLAGNGCGLMSDSKVNLNSAPTVTGSGWAVYGVNGCGPGACPDPGMTFNYFMPPANDPLSGLKTASFTLTAGTTTPCSPPAAKCTTYSQGSFNKLTVNTGDTVHFKPGVYSFSGNVNIPGGIIDCPTCSCVSNPQATSGTTGVNIIITGSGTKLTINGATITLCAGTNYSGTSAALNGVLIDDQGTGAVSVSGNAGTSPVKLDGAIYAPNTDISWSGTSAFANNTCAEVIGNTLTLTGSSYMSTSNCVAGTVPQTQLVALVQ